MNEKIEELEGKVDRLKEDLDWWQTFGWGFVIVAVVLFVSVVYLCIQNGNGINVKDTLSPYICEKENATVASVDWKLDSENYHKLAYLKIVCKKEEPLRDSWLYVIGDDEK